MCVCGCVCVEEVSVRVCGCVCGGGECVCVWLCVEEVCALVKVESCSN